MKLSIPLLLVVTVLILTGCGSAKKSRENSPPRHRAGSAVPQLSSTMSSSSGSIDQLGYQSKRDLLVDMLEMETEPDLQAQISMQLADLAEETRTQVVAQKVSLEQYHNEKARKQMEELEDFAGALLDDELKMLGHIARDFPEYSRGDEALYRLGFILLQRERTNQALQHIRALFTTYPSSPYVAHGYLAFANHFFNIKELDQAIKLYGKVIAFENPQATAEAHHKLGQCWFERGEHEKSLQSFIEATKTARMMDNQTGDELREEALKDLVRTYAKVGAPKKALEFFEKIDQDRIDDMMERLGVAYFDDGRYKDSIVINQQVSDRVECSPVQARAQVSVFEARLYLGEIDNLKDEGDKLVEVFTRLSECLPTEKLDEFAEAGAMAKEQLKAQAKRYRAEYEISNEPAAAEMAVQLDAMADSF